jgi:nitrite reductase/ring-hydroxylating ferredoxin subunit
MRNTLLFSFIILMFSGCNSDDDRRSNNPFVVNIGFSIQLGNINALDLQIPSNPVYVPNGGVRGVFVINTGSGLRAWEATDPNHSPNECSTMVINGINVVCQCEDAHTYNLFTGQASGETLDFTMIPYRVEQSGDVIVVSN